MKRCEGSKGIAIEFHETFARFRCIILRNLAKVSVVTVLVPAAAQSQVQRKPVIEPAASAVISGPFAPLWQLGAGIRYGDWSYEARYGFGLPLGPDVGNSGTFRDVALYARQNVSNIFYWMAGAMYASYKYTTPASRPDFRSSSVYEHTWHSISPAAGLGVGYKYIFLELQAYYPGVLIGIRVGVN